LQFSGSYYLLALAGEFVAHRKTSGTRFLMPFKAGEQRPNYAGTLSAGILKKRVLVIT
jgi:hypothetical protein